MTHGRCAVGPYVAERYIKRDDPAWAAAAARLQASADAAEVAAVAGVRRLAAVAEEGANWGQPSNVPRWQLQQRSGQAKQQFQKLQHQRQRQWQRQRQDQQQQPHQQQRRQQDAAISAQPATVSGQNGSHVQGHVIQVQQQTDSQRRRLMASSHADGATGQEQGGAAATALPAAEADRQAAALWTRVEQALLAAGPHAVKPPGTRTNAADFVRLGLRMDRCASALPPASREPHELAFPALCSITLSLLLPIY